MTNLCPDRQDFFNCSLNSQTNLFSYYQILVISKRSTKHMTMTFPLSQSWMQVCLFWKFLHNFQLQHKDFTIRTFSILNIYICIHKGFSKVSQLYFHKIIVFALEMRHLNSIATTLRDNDSSTTKNKLGKTFAFSFLRLSYAPTWWNRTQTHTFYLPSKNSQHCEERARDNEDQMPTFTGSHILLGLGWCVICTWTHVGWDAWAAFA